MGQDQVGGAPPHQKQVVADGVTHAKFPTQWLWRVCPYPRKEKWKDPKTLDLLKALGVLPAGAHPQPLALLG
jgi:hypothetical protein